MKHSVTAVKMTGIEYQVLWRQRKRNSEISGK